MRGRWWLAVVACGLAVALAGRTGAAPSRAERMAWWTEARFGMFIHWGVYSIPARGEWVMFNEKIPAEEYAKFADQFDPQRFHPDEWVQLAKAAGMRYMVMTSRHHDGYSLFDSQVSDFTAPKRAAGRDLVRAYLDACHRADMRVGLYYSLLDWRAPAYWAGPGKDPAAWVDFRRYVHAQVRELCSNYGRLDILWYDGGWPHNAYAWRSNGLNAMVRTLQPGIIINNRSQVPEDFGTPEQEIPSPSDDRAWESCMTLNDHWGYCAADHNWKTPATVVRNLAKCVSGGGNYLLNVGPKPDGTIPEESVRILREVGQWLRVNGRAIYGCGRAPFGIGDLGVTTARGSTVYLHLWRWPGETMSLAGVGEGVKSARLLAGGRRLAVKQEGETVTISGLPARMPDERGTVVEVDLRE